MRKIIRSFDKDDNAKYSRDKCCLILINYINKHKISCENPNCICQEAHEKPLESIQSVNVNDKTIMTTKYKGKILMIMIEDFDRFILQNKAYVDLHYMFAQFMVDHAKSKFHAYFKLTELLNRQQINKLQKRSVLNF
jgi:hypothetical protein